MADAEGKNQEESAEEILKAIEPDKISAHDAVAAAFNAFVMLDGIDTEMVSKETARKIKAIQRMSINITYDQIKAIHDTLCKQPNEPDD